MLGSLFRRALSRLVRHGWSTAVFVLVLSTGVGLSAGAFSVAWGVFLRGLPFDQPDRLVRVARDVNGGRIPVAATDYIRWRTDQSAFLNLAAWQGSSVNFGAGSQAADHLNGAYVTHELFDALGIRPAIGRTFTAEDEIVGAAPVAIIGDDIWETYFSRRADAVGQLVRIDGTPTTLIGVMPTGFGFPLRQQVWLPLTLNPAILASGKGPSVQVFGRLRRGTALAQARENLATLDSRAIERSAPQAGAAKRVVVEPYVLSYTEDSRPAIYLLLAGSFLLLVVVCANAGALAYADGRARAFEHAICQALGESRRQLAMRLAAESLLLGLGSALLSFPIAYLILRLYLILHGGSLDSFWMSLDLTGWPTVFAVIVAILAALTGYFVPVLRALRSDPVDALKPGSAGGDVKPALGGLMVVEFAACTALLAAMGLLVNSFENRTRVVVGSHPEEVLTAQLMLPLPRYGATATQLSFFARLEENLEATFGRGQVAFSSALVGGFAPSAELEIQGEAPIQSSGAPTAAVIIVSPNYFSVLGEPPLVGRAFAPSDRSDAEPVLVVSKSYADDFLKGLAAPGRRIRLRLGGDLGAWRTVVGVVPDFLASGDGVASKVNVFLPMAQSPATWMSVVLHKVGDPLRAGEIVRAAVRRLDPDVPVFWISTLTQRSDNLNQGSKGLAALFSTFGLIAFALSLVGAYGVTRLTTAARAHEIAVRIALGAARSNVVRALIVRGFAEVLLGIGLGLFLTTALHRFLSTLLFKTAPMDLKIIAAVCCGEIALALCACLVPAMRALRGRPFDLLRSS